MIRQAFQSPLFERKKKRLSKAEIAVLDRAVERVCADPAIGERKKGDLAGVYVHKFKVGERLFLVAYEFNDEELLLLTVGAHENFYRDLKRYLT